MDAVGWVDPVIVNQRTGQLVDGHARIEEALTAGLTTVPVITIDVSEEEERLILATLDPVGALAQYDAAVLTDLVGLVSTQDNALRGLLDDLVQTETNRFGAALGVDGVLAKYGEWDEEAPRVVSFRLPGSTYKRWSAMWADLDGDDDAQKALTLLGKVE